MFEIRKFLWAIVIATGMLVFSYWVTNLPFPISGEKAVLTNFETVRSYFSPPENYADSVLLINVSYDKQLVYKYGVNESDTIGQTVITDRKKLLQLLTELKQKNDYRYIMLDVIFEDERTDIDSVLFATILETPNIVIPCSRRKQLLDERLYQKAGLATYWLTQSESDFVKYPYLTDTIESLPVKMYEDLTGHHIQKHGLFYTDEGKLVRSSIVLTMDYMPTDSIIDSTGQKWGGWHNLGVVIRDGVDEIYTKNKYIIIGSFAADDLHDTYRGPMYGAIINFNAFRALMAGHHQMSMTLGVLLFVSFFIFGYLILCQRKLSDVIHLATPSKRRGVKLGARIAIALCSWLGFSSYLSILCIITYVYLGEVYDIFITSTVFWLMSKIVQLKQYVTHGKSKNS